MSKVGYLAKNLTQYLGDIELKPGETKELKLLWYNRMNLVIEVIFMKKQWASHSSTSLYSETHA